MESSRRYLIVAEIAFWREMLHFNKKVLSDPEIQVMRYHLKEAEDKLFVGRQYTEWRAAA